MKGESTDMSTKLKIDEIGYWSEVKLAILDEYAKPYNQILHKNGLKTIYIDGFAGQAIIPPRERANHRR